MIIHNPKISGSLQFPSDENGNLITLQIQNGTLETKTLNSSGVDQGIQPAVNYSGSFTGSFVGDGSSLTGVAASGFNIDILDAVGGASVAQSDTFLISDSGTEKKITFSNIEDSIFANVSGDISIAAGGAVTLGKDGVISGSAQLLNVATDFGSGRVSGEDFGDVAGTTTFTGSFVGDGASLEGVTSYTDSDNTDHLNSLGVVSGSDQVASTFAQTILDDADAGAVRTTIGVDAAGTVNYVLPTNLAGDDIDIDTTALTGATVISDLDINITTNTSGLVTDANGTVSTRDLTKGDIGLGNVDNTSDANKPVSTAGQTALDLKANLASPALSGNPTAPTQTGTDDSTKIATTAFVQDRIDTIIGNAGSTLDTLGELSASLDSDSGSLASLVTTVGGKLQKDQNLSDLTNASTARTNLGVAIGSDVQAFNSTLATVAGGTYAGDNSIVTVGTVTTGNVQAILPSGVVSGSDQVNALASDVNNNTITFTAGAGLDGGGAITLNQSSDETVTFTVGDGVISGSSQVSGITNTQLAGSIANAKLSNSSITIDGSAISLGGSVTTLQLGTSSSTALAGDTTTISGGQASAITANTSKVGYTDALVKAKLDTDLVSSGSASNIKSFLSISSSDISDVAAFSQSGTYASLRAQGTTAGDVGLGNVTNESKSTMFASPTFTGTTVAPTPSSNDDSTKIATTAYVQQELTDLVGTAGSTLDTLGELSASLASDQSGLASLTTTVGTKLAKASNLSDLSNAGTARTNLGVDAAGTDNSTDVTLAGNDYLTISGQVITAGAINNDDLTNSSITINGSAVSLGGSVTTPNDNTQLSTEAVQDIVGGMLGGTETGITVTYQDGTGDIDFVVASQTDENFTTADHSKLDGIEAGAEVNRTAAETRTLIGTGNGNLVPAAGSSGEFLKHDGTFGTPSYTTNTNTQLTQEQVEDFVGGMLDGTETGITVGYDDTNGNLDFVVASQTDNNFTTTLKNKLDGIAESANNYVLPTNLAGDDIDIDTTALTGATVISDLDINITTNTSGLVTDANGSVSTRTLTKSDIGLGNVTNESKSTMFASPTFTGTTVAPTPSADDNSTKIATTAYVQGELTGLIGGAPAAFDTLLEISASIANGDSDVVALTTTVGGKLQKDQNLSDLTNAATARTNLGVDAAGTVNYVLPTNLAGDDINIDTGALTGATVISDLDFNITTDTSGRVTDANGTVATRTLTAGNLGLGSGDDVTFGTLRIDDATSSSSKTTGALIVDGGVGIAGALNVGGDVVAYASSDERLKDNIELISNPIEKVQSLKGVTWNWNDNADELQQSLPNVGVIAQDVEKVLPQLVTDRDNGFKGVDYAKLTGLLIEAVKDQQKQIDELKSKLS